MRTVAFPRKSKAWRRPCARRSGPSSASCNLDCLQRCGRSWRILRHAVQAACGMSIAVSAVPTLYMEAGGGSGSGGGDADKEEQVAVLRNNLRGSLEAEASVDSRVLERKSEAANRLKVTGMSASCSWSGTASAPAPTSPNMGHSRSAQPRHFMPMATYKGDRYTRLLDDVGEALRKKGAVAAKMSDTIKATPPLRPATPGDLLGPAGHKRVRNMESEAEGGHAPPVSDVRTQALPGVPIDEPKDEEDDALAVRSTERVSKKRSWAKAVDSHLGLSGQSHTVHFDEKALWQSRVESFVRGWRWEYFTTFIVICSTVQLGAQTDYMARYMLVHPPLVFNVIDWCFWLFFVIDIGLRIFAFRSKYFSMWGCGWHWLDMILVIVQAVEECLFLATGTVENKKSQRWLIRVARVLRVLRSVRIFRLVNLTDSLRLLVSCLVHSSASFCWAVTLILLILYVFGITWTHITVYERIQWQLHDVVKDTMLLEKWYGTVPRAVLSLFQGVTGGVSWDELVRPIIDLCSPWLGFVFFLYSAFVIIAVMNVVTATFVQNAIERHGQAKELQKMTRAARLFKTLDVDDSGSVSYAELERHLGTKEVVDFFESIDVDVAEARPLFEMLDFNNRGQLDFNEFLSGVIRLQGPAKAIDLVMVMRELKESVEKQPVLS
mmetsp:Transcript_72899/g.236917  ORF Transcript_72899/g.236917 Transcript_72899/m.236917 type:complete len:663 (+) Transcript_72899:72-2060(+)